MTQSAIPPVSLSLYDEDFPAFAQAFGSQLERYGFGVLGDHGLPDDLIQKAYGQSKAFFDLPTETKSQYHLKNGGARGYTPFGIETAKGHTAHDLKEFWHMGRDLPQGHPFETYMPPNVWPSECPEFQPTFQALYAAFDALGQKLLRAIATYLDIDPDYFLSTVDEGNSVLRMLHYPPVQSSGESVRAGAHGDINVITLLLGAEEPGLQILDRNGEWLPITPPAGCLAINIGDMLSRLTNHRLPSTVHRVINPAASRKDFSRYSMPFFLHFEPTFEIKTLDNCITPDRPNAYPEGITAEDFLQQRLREIKLT